MTRHNAQNTRIKRDYFDYLKHAQRRDEASIDVAAKALARFEDFTGQRDFRKFHIAQAKAFKAKLTIEKNVRTGKPLSTATVHTVLAALRAFFIWLADKPGYKSRIAYTDADYFNLSEKEVRVARAKREKPVPTLEQVHHVLDSMPAESDIEMRNRALIAFALLTGARGAALATLKLKHVNLAEGCVFQDARDVKTKNSKTFTTWFCPVGGNALQIATAWCEHLRKELLWRDDDPLLPKTLTGLGEHGGFQALGLEREHWKGTGPIRNIYRDAFAAAGLPYSNPHCFRDTLVQLGERLCRSPEEFKAWSQNIGHEKVLTTFTSYGQVSPQRQAALIRGLGDGKDDVDGDRLAALVAETVRKYRAGK